jgi:alkylation response protein AidB-like acyl-CoA dehydrogenase
VDLSYPPDVESFRREVQAILAAELPEDFSGLGSITDDDEAHEWAERWRAILHRNRLIGVTWPGEYGGRGLSRLHQVALVEELARAGVPFGMPRDAFSVKMLANTLLAWGTAEQRRRFLPGIASGDEKWCQGFSEPGAGSDLASLTTRAVLDGEEWVINGQKIWTSHAYEADWIFALCRTDPDAPKHKGISFLLIPCDQPGVEIRRIRQLTGRSDFCEVFFTDARTRADLVVGPVGGGWDVAKTLLGFERGEEAATNPILFRAELDRLIALAQLHGVASDPVIRRRLAECLMQVEVMRYLGYRILTSVAKNGKPGPESSISKLYWSEYHQKAANLALDILGAQALIPAGRAPLRDYRTDDPGVPPTSTASWQGTWGNAICGTIYAGASEVQRNILAETILGLPREPRVGG